MSSTPRATIGRPLSSTAARRTTNRPPLDWMLRARIAESQGRLVEALAHLKHIPDSDLISSQAWLKAGQIELSAT